MSLSDNTDIPALLEAYDFAQYDEQSLSNVPAFARQLLRDLLDEVEREYRNAQLYCGTQIWASMQRHAGDPCWETCSTRFNDAGEFLT